MVVDYIRAIQGKKKNEKKANFNLYRTGFHLLQGILGGIAINDIFRLLNLPGNNVPVIYPDGRMAGFDWDYVAAVAIGLVFIAGDVAKFVPEVFSATTGAGIILGNKWANLSEHGKYIGNIVPPSAYY